MKRGLKWNRRWRLSAELTGVKEDSPMKRGLKCRLQRSRHQDSDRVKEDSPMKRGLKYVVSARTRLGHAALKRTPR